MATVRRESREPTRYPGVQRVGDGAYRIRAKVRDPRTGRTKEVDQLVEGVSAQQAAAVRGTRIEQVRGGTANGRGGDRVRVGDYARSWMKSKARSLDAGTAERYAEALDLHVLPAVGDLYFDALRRADVQRWADECNGARKPGGGPYSVVTVRGWFRVLRSLTADAIVDLELEADPTLRIRFPEAPERDEPNALEPAALVRFLAAMLTTSPQDYPISVALAWTGLRFCHVSGLQWGDLDDQTGVLTVRRKHVRGRVGPVSRRKRAPRLVPLAPELVSLLGSIRPEGAAPERWMFPAKGKPATPRLPGSLWKSWRRALKAAEIGERFTVHGLRRTFVDLSRRAGTDPLVQKALSGHVTERMREHYSSVSIEEKRAAAVGVARLAPLRLVPMPVEVGTGVGTEQADKKKAG